MVHWQWRTSVTTHDHGTTDFVLIPKPYPTPRPLCKPTTGTLPEARLLFSGRLPCAQALLNKLYLLDLILSSVLTSLTLRLKNLALKVWWNCHVNKWLETPGQKEQVCRANNLPLTRVWFWEMWPVLPYHPQHYKWEKHCWCDGPGPRTTPGSQRPPRAPPLRHCRGRQGAVGREAEHAGPSVPTTTSSSSKQRREGGSWVFPLLSANLCNC